MLAILGIVDEMANERKDHGEPPTFAKWLIWLLQKDTWTEYPVIATVATIIAVSIAATGIHGVIKLLPTEDIVEPVEKSPVDTDRKVVVLMDSTLPEVVYDPQTQSNGGTNADDISDALDDLPIQIVKETTSLIWDRDEQVLQLDPDLIIIHLSAFYDQTNPQDSGRKLESFLRFVAISRAHFIMYSRAPTLESEIGQTQWVQQIESQIPQLQSRVQLLYVPAGPAATFRDTNTARRLKMLVKTTLKL